MSGIFGVVSKENCKADLFYGTDYHFHLGTSYAGLALSDGKQINREIHRIEKEQFKAKFEHWVSRNNGQYGIGVISDGEPQPLVIKSHLGKYAIVHVGKVSNLDDLTERALKRGEDFSEMSNGETNAVELIASLINEGSDFTEGLLNAQEKITGSSSIILMTSEGIYASRDRYGRTPLVTANSGGRWAVASESCSFPTRGFDEWHFLGPGEIDLITPDGVQMINKPGDRLQICTFLYVYYGFPASNYEGINVEETRYRCGAALARNDDIEVDFAAGIPDSGTAHAHGYANEKRIPHKRPLVKYTPTYLRSFMPVDPIERKLLADMKLIPIKSIIQSKRMVLNDDSVVRATQLGDLIGLLFDKYHAAAVHLRPACPPLFYGCPHIGFSRSRSEMDLAARRAAHTLGFTDIEACAREGSHENEEIIEQLRKEFRLTTLKYQKLNDLIEAVGLPKEKLCTYCWDGCK